MYLGNDELPSCGNTIFESELSRRCDRVDLLDVSSNTYAGIANNSRSLPSRQLGRLLFGLGWG